MHNYLFFPPPKTAFNQEKNDEVILRREPKVRAGLFFPPPKAAFNQEKNDEVILRREPRVRAGLFFPPPKAAFAVPGFCSAFFRESVPVYMKVKRIGAAKRR